MPVLGYLKIWCSTILLWDQTFNFSSTALQSVLVHIISIAWSICDTHDNSCWKVTLVTKEEVSIGFNGPRSYIGYCIGDKMASAIMVGIGIICTMLVSAHLSSASSPSGSFRTDHEGNNLPKVWWKFRDTFVSVHCPCRHHIFEGSKFICRWLKADLQLYCRSWRVLQGPKMWAASMFIQDRTQTLRSRLLCEWNLTKLTLPTLK
jgi:hypothetical protein